MDKRENAIRLWVSKDYPSNEIKVWAMVPKQYPGRELTLMDGVNVDREKYWSSVSLNYILIPSEILSQSTFLGIGIDLNTLGYDDLKHFDISIERLLQLDLLGLVKPGSYKMNVDQDGSILLSKYFETLVECGFFNHWVTRDSDGTLKVWNRKPVRTFGGTISVTEDETDCWVIWQSSSVDCFAVEVSPLEHIHEIIFHRKMDHLTSDHEPLFFELDILGYTALYYHSKIQQKWQK